MTTKPLIIKDWQKGMADSPNVGIGLIKNCSIDTLEGALVPQYAPVQKNVTAYSSVFTADPATDICTVSTQFGTQMITGTAIQFTTTGALPAGLSTGTDYFIIKLSATTFKVASTYANSQSATAINITDAGTGTQTIATIDLGTPNSVADDILNQITYIADSNGRVWYSVNTGPLILLTGNTRTNGKGMGLAYFINSDATGSFLFVYRNALLDVCNVTTQARRQDPVGTSSWTNGWKSLNTAAGTQNSHHSIVGQDNIIYFADDRYVGSIVENAGSVFDPATSATYTYNNQALRLPQGELAWWLDELGINLLTAGKTYDRIYPWDRSSPSFGLPIVCAELGVYRIKNVNNTVFIFNGTRGNIYKTQGALVTLAKKLPEYVIGNAGAANITWGGVASKGGSVIFGVTCTTTGQAGALMSGVYSLWPDGRLIIENQLATATTTGVTTINKSTGEFYNFAGPGEFDIIDTNRYTNLLGIFQSQMYEVATKTEKATYSQLEVQLNQPSNGGQVKISYRTSFAVAFTELATFVAAASTTSFTQDIGLKDLENIQVQAEIGGTASNTNMLQVMEIRLLP